MLLIGHAMMHKARDFVARCKHRFNNVVVPCEHSQHYGVGEAMTENKFFFFFASKENVLVSIAIVLYDPIDSRVCVRTLSETKITHAI